MCERVGVCVREWVLTRMMIWVKGSESLTIAMVVLRGGR